MLPVARTLLALGELTPAERGERFGFALVGVVVILSALAYIIIQRIKRSKQS